MSTTRKLTKSEEIIIDFILTESEKSRQSITEVLTKISDDPFIIATVCTRALTDTHKERCKNIICEVINILKSDQTTKVHEELRKMINRTQLDNFFLAHINDDYPETLRMLGECGVSADSLKNIVHQQNKHISTMDIKNWILHECRNINDYSLIHLFASKAVPDNAFGSALLIAISEIPSKDKNRTDTIKKLIKANVPFNAYFTGSTHLNSFDHAVDLKDFEVIGYMSEIASSQENKENIQYIAKGVARAISTDKIMDYCHDIIKAVNKNLNPQSKNYLAENLRKKLTPDHINKLFLSHVNDSLPSDVLDMCIHYGIDANTYLKAIETCADIKNAKLYLNNFLETKPESIALKNVIQIVIDLSIKAKDWCLADLLASKVIPGNEDAYGNLLLWAAKNNQKEIVKKLIKNYAKFTWYTHAGNKYALHLMVENKWDDIIEELLTNAEGIKLLAEGIALAIAPTSTSNEIIKIIDNILYKKNSLTRASFYEALHLYLTQQQVDDLFVKHINDKTWSILNILMGYGVSADVLLKNLEATTLDCDRRVYIDRLLEQKLDPSQCEKIITIAISRSRKNKNWLLIEQLINKSAQIPGSETFFGKALLEIIKENKSQNQDIIEKLIQSRPSFYKRLEDSNNTALHLVAERGDLELTCRLLSANANQYLTNKEHKTADNLAIDNGHYYVAAIIKSVSECKIEKIKLQQDKYTIDQLNTLYRIFIKDDKSLQSIINEDLMLKQQEKKSESLPMRTEFAKFIFNNVSECKTKTALNSSLDILKSLIKDNILKLSTAELYEILNYRDDQGNTVLHKAVMNGHFHLVEILMDVGANPETYNSLGESSIFLAEKYSNLTIAKFLKRHPYDRSSLSIEINQFGLENYELYLRKNEKKTKRIIYKALESNHTAIQEAINQCYKHYHYGRLFINAAIGIMCSELDLQLAFYRSDITGLKIDNLSWLTNGVSELDKVKLKYVQEFFTNNLETFRDIKKQEKFKDLDPFTLILLVMKQKLKNSTYKEITTKHKIESSIRSIMRDELEMSPIEIDKHMERSYFIIDKILGLNTNESELKTYVNESDPLRTALKGEVSGLRKMIDTYHKDTQTAEFAKLFQFKESWFPRHGRLMLFCAAIAAFVGESDYATYLFYLQNLNVITTFRSFEKSRVLHLMKKFYIYSFEVSKDLKQQYKIDDPFMSIFLVLEYASKHTKFSDGELKTINERLKMSLNAAMIEEGGFTQAECDTFINEKQTRVAAIIKSNPFTESSVETSIQHQELPPAYTYVQPSAPLIPMVATPVPQYMVTTIPPLAEVVLPIVTPPPAAVVIEEPTESAPLAATQVAEPEIIISNNTSTLFSQPKLPSAVIKDLEYLQLREQLLDMPMPPNTSLLKDNSIVNQPEETIKKVVTLN